MRLHRNVWRAATVIPLVMSVGCMAGGGRGGHMGGGGAGGLMPGGEGVRYINPGTLAALDGFTHAVRIGLTIYISGEVPLDSTGHLVGPGDLRAQARQAFANLAFVLEIAGATPADVTKLNVYVVNYRPENSAVIREAGAAFFPQRNPPTGLVLGVQALPRDGMLIAVDAIAVTRGMIQPKVRDDRP